MQHHKVARTRRVSAHVRTALAAGVIAAAGSTAVAAAAASEQPVSGTAAASALGNPLVVNITGAPALPLPLPADPASAPRGPSPDKHVYVTTSAGQAVTYATAEFQLPKNVTGKTLTLTFRDDSALLENSMPETAALSLCALPGQIDTNNPNAAVPYDCVVAVRGTRTAGTNGGTWTYEADQLAGSVSQDGRLGLAVVPVPAGPTDTSTVAILRDSVKVTFSGTVTSESAPETSVLPATPDLAPTDEGVTQPSGEGLASGAGLSSGSAPVVEHVPVNAAFPVSPQVAPLTSPTATAPTASLVPSGSTTSTRSDRWRALLLLLVPAVPFFGLGVYRRVAEADADPSELMARYPGLASLSP